MIRINLLPHREERRKARRTQFYALLGIVVFAAGAAWLFGHLAIASRIDAQKDKNSFLQQDIGRLDKQIAEIKSLKQQTQALLERKRVIESLQANRAETVHIFNELAQRIPEGVYVRRVQQTGLKINLSGFAQANARVSTLMHNLDESPLLENPELVEIRAEMVGAKRLSAFTMNVHIKREVKDPKKLAAGAAPARPDAPGAKPAAGAPAAAPAPEVRKP